MCDLTVIMPVYNESEIIEKVISSWLYVLKGTNIDFEIKVFNDGSIDNSLEVLKEIQKNNRELVVIDKINSGHGPTIISGYRAASSRWIFQVDSDGEIESCVFSELWRSKDNYDLVIGERRNRKSTFSRKIITLMSQFTIRLFYGKGIGDVNSPCRLYRSDKFHDVFLRIPSNTFAPNVILSGYAVKKKLKILRIPILCRFRKTGVVSIKKLKLLKAAYKSFVQTVMFSFSI